MLRQWRIHNNAYVNLSVVGYDIILNDVITGDEVYSKTVDQKYIPYIQQLFTLIGEKKIKPDVILRYAKINNTKFKIQYAGDQVTFMFSTYIRPLIECCYIVAAWWGATLEEIGWCGPSYRVKFHNVGGWKHD